MGGAPLEMSMDSFGVSPWELEVAYGYFGARFAVRQGGLAEDPGFVSSLRLRIPVGFSREFFDWFEFRRWEKVKALLREMKRRRGRRRALRVELEFAGSPSVSFVVDAADGQLFGNAVEKIDFVVELLPYHLGPGELPPGATGVTYRYDEARRAWHVAEAVAGGARLARRGGGWAGAA